MASRAGQVALRVVLADPRFVEAWHRYLAALRFNAGDWPEWVPAARAVAASCGAWEPAVSLGSNNDWQSALADHEASCATCTPIDRGAGGR